MKNHLETELERFKSDINLTEYAASCGYSVDRRKTSNNSVTMRHPGTADKIIVSRGHDGHWIYFSARDRNDNGSIIDFVQNRRAINLGEVRYELRPWLKGTVQRPSVNSYVPEIELISKDQARVQHEFFLAEPLGQYGMRYLSRRGLSHDTIMFFYELIRQGWKNNVLFPHFDNSLVCGFEVKNFNFTGFAKHGEKTFWLYRCEQATRLVIAESAIDCMSYHQLRGDPYTSYVSLAGQFSPRQQDLLAELLLSFPALQTVVLAFDNDQGGDSFAETIGALVPDHLNVMRDGSPVGNDWNDAL